MARYEVPAVVVVDVDDDNWQAAQTKVLDLSATLDCEYGPGAFFYGIGVAVTGDEPRRCEGDRESETIAQHTESLLAAAGVWT